MMPAPWQDLLDWWFGQGCTAQQIVSDKQPLWFGYKPEQDREARERFGDLCDQACAGGLLEWSRVERGWLALVLLLDQLPRMIHRGTPRAFAGDERARQLVSDGMLQGRDRLLAPIERTFIYLVLEHAENLSDQELAVARFTALCDMATPEERPAFAGFLDYARRHRDVIARFGRFPHRNAMLGRVSSEAEQGYLDRPGSGF